MTEGLVKEADSFNFLYIPCDPEGDVVVMSNGSGMLMSCIDHLARKGRKVAAVLDLGGGATSDRIRHAVRILFLHPRRKTAFHQHFRRNHPLRRGCGRNSPCRYRGRGYPPGRRPL